MRIQSLVNNSFLVFSFACLLLFPFVSNAQTDKDRYIDSLKNIISETKNDKQKVECLLEWNDLIYLSDEALDFELNERIIAICNKKIKESDTSYDNFFLRVKGVSTTNLGVISKNRGDLKRAFTMLTEGERISRKVGDKIGYVSALINLGVLYEGQAKYEMALKYLEDAKASLLSPLDADGVDEGSIHYTLSNINSNIASIYALLFLESNNESKELYLDTAMLKCQLVIDQTKEYRQLSKDEDITLELDVILAYIYNEIALLYFETEKYNEAFRYYDMALTISRDINYVIGISAALDGHAKCYFQKGNVKLAISTCREALEIAEGQGDIDKVMLSSQLLSDYYKADKNYSLSLKYYEQYVEFRDSVFNLSNERTLIQQDYKNQYQRKFLSDSLNHINEEKIKDAVIEKQEIKLGKERNQKIGLILFSILLLLIAALIYRSSRQKRRINKVMSFQKKKVEAHRKKIVDSITYAEKIQKALLTSTSELKTVFPGAVNLNMPKDIVSGDFFWCHQEGDTSYLALSDCTGHGVPGAFMSIIGANLLKEVILKKKDSNLGEILFELDKELIETLSQYDEAATADGMDIGIIKVNHTTRNIEFAGANQNLFIINEQGTNIIKGELRSVGGWVRKRSRLPNFTVKSFSMEGLKGIYLATDGLEDQLGGPNNVKFGRDTFVSLISEMGNSPDMDVIRKAFDEWKGSN
ncbi:MAG: tetratricopeptide repeat protein, partial [Crocinitomicaceae bacterium]